MRKNNVIKKRLIRKASDTTTKNIYISDLETTLDFGILVDGKEIDTEESIKEYFKVIGNDVFIPSGVSFIGEKNEGRSCKYFNFMINGSKVSVPIIYDTTEDLVSLYDQMGIDCPEEY